MTLDESPTEPGAGSQRPKPESSESATPTRSLGSGGSASGVVIGPYRLLELIGQGGMGEVWLAEQTHPLRRRVALKLIKVGMDTRDVVARFESERQALALMDHPAIAKIFDAGSTPDGRPFFVMEYVPGMSITAYCDKHKLTTRQRLDLFIQVCEGVQHAHQKAIIHRDLKPSNILVGEVNDRPIARIIDFGVAKATAQRLSDATLYTQIGEIIGTLGYLSPEQADSAGRDVDTRTDVYSLGVVLYELLVGVLPLDFHKVAFDRALRLLREEEAAKPSTKLRTLREQSAVTAQNRGADPPALLRELEGDLDAITLKALEKERNRRYATPLELSADIERYVRNEPVLARPAGALYRARKYVRRHRLGVAVAAAALVLLVVFVVLQAVQLRRITRERDRADRITKFMTDMFRVSDPRRQRRADVTAREVLDQAAKEIDSGLSSDPVLQAKLMSIMGITYYQLGRYPESQSLLERALEIQRRVLGPRNRDTLSSAFNLASALDAEGHHTRGEKLYRETWEIQRQVLGPEDPDTLFTLNNIAGCLNEIGRFSEAEKLERQVVEMRSRVLGPEERHTLVSKYSLADILHQEGRDAEAETVSRQAVESLRRVAGPDHPDTLTAMNTLSNALEAQGKYAEAEKVQREAFDIRFRMLGPGHADTLMSMGNLAIILQKEGHPKEAETLDQQVLEGRRRTLGPEHPDTLASLNNLAVVLQDEGRWAEAEKLHREALETDRRALGPEHPYTLFALANVGIDVSHTGHYDEGARLFREAIQTASKANQPGVIDTLWFYFGCIAAQAGHREEAFEYLGNALDHGYREAADMETEKDLQSLHSDPRFAALLARARQPAPNP